MLLNALRNGASSLFGLVSVAVVSSALVGCGDGSKSPLPNEVAQGGSTTPKLEKVKLQLNWVAEPEFGGFYAAQDKALFQNEGIEVEIVQGGPGVPAPQLAASGKVDFAIVAAPQVVELAEQGGDLRKHLHLQDVVERAAHGSLVSGMVRKRAAPRGPGPSRSRCRSRCPQSTCRHGGTTKDEKGRSRA
jgi:hypothetical protein